MGRWLGYIGDDEEIEIVSFENRKRVLVKKKFDKEKWAEEIYNKYAKNITVLIRQYERCVVCIHRKSHRVGYSFCRPRDKFNEKIGIAIAICRAFNFKIPKEIFED